MQGSDTESAVTVRADAIPLIPPKKVNVCDGEVKRGGGGDSVSPPRSKEAPKEFLIRWIK